MRHQRASVVVVLALSVPGSSAIAQRAADQGPPNALAALAGRWQADSAATMIRALEVRVDGSQTTIHAWARCQPTDCDWGESRADVYVPAESRARSGPALSAVFSTDAWEGQLILFPTQDRLTVQVLTRFKDASRPRAFALGSLAREGALASERSPAGAPRPVRVGGRVAEPRKTRNANPVYPDAAKQSRVQGVVVMECIIGTDGDVTEVRVLRGIPMLDDAAVEAVKQWRYQPTLLDGVAVPVIMTVTVSFKLS